MKYAALLPLIALAACTTTGRLPPTEVLRYHLPDGVERGPTSVESAQAGLMSQPYEAAVARQLGLNGYPPPGAGPSQLIAVVDVRNHERAGPPRRSPITIGIGGGTFSGGRRGGVGLGGGVDFPVGSARGSTLVETELSVLLKRRADQTTVWEGHARTVADPRRRDASEGATAEKLAAALFTGFPGESGALSACHDHQHPRGRMTVSINSAFDGGNIRVVSIDGDRVDLEIVKDKDSDFYQWFYFRAAGAPGRTLTFRIVNCAKSAYPFGWPGYRTRASTDREAWRLTDTTYEGGVLEWRWTFATPLAWFAYFAPFTMERHEALVARTALAPHVEHRELGRSLDGQPIDYFRLGSGAKQVWLYARQHPGEPMAEWWMEGALAWLTGDAAADLLAKATVHVVPNMNPDGTRRGHLRTNAAGVNLNREWHAPSAERSPEVLCVRDAMDATGVDFAIDVHGDEAIPANFIAGYEGIPSWNDDHGAKFYAFGDRLAAHTADFQVGRGYEKSSAGNANLSMSTNQLAERFGAVSVTLEMPFKDHDPHPDPEFGWSPERSRRLAVACLEVLTGMIDQI